MKDFQILCSVLLMSPLGVSSDVLSVVQRVCDRALNLPMARTKSHTHGAKAAMKLLYGKTVNHLPGGGGVVKDRPLKFVVQKKRRSGKSGKSNWPKNKAERLARVNSRAERALRAALKAEAAALRRMIREMDNGKGAYVVRCSAEWMAIEKVRDALSAETGIPASGLSPSAAIAATLLPGSIDAYTNGFVVSTSESNTNTGLPRGEAMRIYEGCEMCEFQTAGIQCGLVLHT